MAYRLNCPCGAVIFGTDDADIIRTGTVHAEDVHGRSYAPEQVMFLAVRIPDSFLPAEMRAEEN